MAQNKYKQSSKKINIKHRKLITPKSVKFLLLLYLDMQSMIGKALAYINFHVIGIELSAAHTVKCVLKSTKT